MGEERYKIAMHQGYIQLLLLKCSISLDLSDDHFIKHKVMVILRGLPVVSGLSAVTRSPPLSNSTPSE
jgi:hypothetical protein